MAPHGTEGLPDELRDFADAISIVQQRIAARGGSADEQADLSRELRRAVQAGRHDLELGRARLAGLDERLHR